MSNTIIHDPPDIETLHVETARNVSCPEFARMVGVDVRKVRQLAKMKDPRYRPPGFYAGKQYRIWVSEIANYLHSEGKYQDGGFAVAMEMVNK